MEHVELSCLIKKGVCLVVAMLVCMMAVQAGFFCDANAKENAGPTRAIAIAYDNSGSMGQGTDKWCGAKYSLEVLAAMLNPGDTISVFTMDSPGKKIELSGSKGSSEAVKSIHDTDLGTSDWTEPRAAQEAFDELSASNAAEKYLVITTDGAFNTSGGLATVQETVSKCEAAGITVIYLAIGSDAETIASNSASGVYVKLASPETILSTMTEVANQIFGRDALPSSSVGSKDGKLCLDVPMSQVIVFAQGKDVSVGNLTASDNTVISPECANVKYSTHPDGEYGPFLVNENLQGVVATFDGNVPSGDCSLEVKGADSVEVYYKPYVDIAVDLVDDRGIEYVLSPGEENELSAGSYNVSYSFLDPYSGEALNSDLLYPATFSMKAESNGDIVALNEGDQLTVSTGAVTLIANAELAGGAKASQSYEGINVSPAVSVLKINDEALADSIDLPSFGNTSYPVTISKDGGTDFSPAEWEALTLEIDDQYDIPWKTEKTDVPGTVNVTPEYIDGDQWATQERIFGVAGLGDKTDTLKMKAVVEGENQVYRGTSSKDVGITPDKMSSLLHMLPFLIGLLLLLFLLVMYLIKPRLPRKMKPHLVFDNEDVYLLYNEKNIKNKFSPFGPERISFSITPKIPSDRSTYNFPSRFQLGTIGLVAAKKKKGKRRFVFDDATIRSMQSHMENPGSYLDPEYSPPPPSSNKKGRNVTSRSKGFALSFTGRGATTSRKSNHNSVAYMLKFS